MKCVSCGSKVEMCGIKGGLRVYHHNCDTSRGIRLRTWQFAQVYGFCFAKERKKIFQSKKNV